MSRRGETLIVDNNLHIGGYPQGAVVRAALGRAGLGARVRKPQELESADWEASRVILTGSIAFVRQEESWMAQERRLIEAWLERGVPLLGIGFGAQLLARHLFGPEAVVPLPWPISGSVQVELNTSSAVFDKLPSRVGVITTHYDGFQVPEEYVIARNDEWPCYGFEVGSVFALQFHPELTGSAGKPLLKLRRLLYDRHVHQDFEVPVAAVTGRKILANFMDLSR